MHVIVPQKACSVVWLPIYLEEATTTFQSFDISKSVSVNNGGFNGQKIKKNSDDTYTIAITNVASYANVDIYNSGRVKITQSYYA